MRDVTQTIYALARETLTERLQQDWIGTDEARNDSTELFGAWKLAWRLSNAAGLDPVCDIARSIWPVPEGADLPALYRAALESLPAIEEQAP